MEIEVESIRGFDVPGLSVRWRKLLEKSWANEIFLTCEWQRTWWEVFGRGTLILLVAKRSGKDVLLAPLFADGGMVYFVGSGGSDYLDFVGDATDAQALAALLEHARGAAPDFAGFLFYHRLGDPAREEALAAAAATCSLSVHVEGGSSAPMLDLAGDPAGALAATRKKSLVRHQRGFERGGTIHLAPVSPRHQDAFLERLFAQHVARWASTPHPSMFTDARQRHFFARLAAALEPTGWLRFTALMWNDRPVALHFGFSYAGRYLWYKPSFDVDLASMSPGEVLLRQLLLAAVEEGTQVFDFGLGDEAFKLRFANSVRAVTNWGLYP